MRTLAAGKTHRPHRCGLGIPRTKRPVTPASAGVAHRWSAPNRSTVSYRGCGPDAPELVFNAANNDVPTVGGQYVEYSPAKVFDSPFLESRYGSGVVEVRKGGEKLILDFREE